MSGITTFIKALLLVFVIKCTGLSAAKAQNNWTFSLKVITKDLETKKQLDGVQYVITDNSTNTRIHSGMSSSSQSIKFNLDPLKDYTLKISKNGYVTKTISVSTKNVPYQDRTVPSIIFEVTTDIFAEEPDEDYSAFRAAFGMILYNENKKDFVWMPNEDAKQKEQELKDRRKRKRNDEEEDLKKDPKDLGKKELSDLNSNRTEAMKKALERDQKRREMEEYRRFLKEEALAATNVNHDEPKMMYANNIQTETIEHRNHIVTETLVTFDAGKKVLYRKIVFDWGGIYYKQDEYDITDVTYDLLMRIIVLKQ